MASHRSTPKAVLNAPTRTLEVLSRQSGYNRAERRRAYRGLDAKGKPAMLLRSKGTIPLDRQFPRTNRPYVKPVAGVRRTVSARVASVAGRVRSTVAGRREVR